MVYFSVCESGVSLVLVKVVYFSLSESGLFQCM